MSHVSLQVTASDANLFQRLKVVPKEIQLKTRVQKIIQGS